jgi:prophage regulatory protein
MRTARNDLTLSGIDRAATGFGPNAALGYRNQKVPDVVNSRMATMSAPLPVLDHRIPGASLDQLRRTAIGVACVTYLPGAGFEQHPGGRGFGSTRCRAAMSGCRTFSGNRVQGCLVTRAMDLLRTSALVRPAHRGPDAVVGFGLVPPDGSAASVSWPVRGGSSFCSTSAVEANAFLCGADLVWMGDGGKATAGYDEGVSLAQHADPDVGRVVNLVGVSEICDLFWKIYRDRFLEVIFRSDFPKPVAELVEGDVWIREEVEEFLVGHGDVLTALFRAAR